MTRTLVLSPEKPSGRVAGMGLRALRIKETLEAHGHSVTLACPAADPSFRLATEVRRAELIVASGHTGLGLEAIRFEGALVADLYDPFLVENLSYRKTLGPSVFEHDRRALVALLSRADLVLAATEEQRLFYLGTLLGLDAFAPDSLDRDPEARDLVAVAPFGIDATEPGPPELPEPFTLSSSDVFFGGVYDWYDPELLLEAWPTVLARVPAARLLFSSSPHPDSTPQHALTRVVTRAEELGLLGRSVLVLPWVPFERRGGLYRACRLAALTHRPSLETQLSFRTRVLDFLWAGLPSVLTPGGAASELVARTGSGLVVPPLAAAIADAIAALLTDEPRRLALAEAARGAARDRGWSAVLSPLLRFAEQPRRRPLRRSRMARAVSRLTRR